MKRCKLCSSYAVNINTKDRKGVKEHQDLCDVCFWKVKYQELKKKSIVSFPKCKGCNSAPYDKNYGRCVTCIVHTKYEAESV